MNESSHLNIVRLPAIELPKWRDAGFVYGTFTRSQRKPAHALSMALRDFDCFCYLATPVGDPTLIGWLIAKPLQNRIVCAYTKAAYRASPDQRAGKPMSEGDDAFRIASSLAIAAGIDFARPVPCSFWSRAAKAIKEKPGNPYSLVYSPEVTR